MPEISTRGKPVSPFLLSQDAIILAPHSPVPAILDSKWNRKGAIQQHQPEKPFAGNLR
jgi:hypothetical protein